MEKEQRICQNCKAVFTIEPEDFRFYEKISVPPPTWCPECRLIRRLSWRNERNFYKRKCDAPEHEEEIISIYPPYAGLTVYDQAYWWSDKWDASSYGREYDFSKPFFEQFKGLLHEVPLVSLDSGALSTVVKSDYCTDAWEVKSCYFCSTIGRSEHCYYDNWVVQSKFVVDSLFSLESENCYECIDSWRCYNVSFAQYAQNCMDSAFLFDCRDCTKCFGCVGLRHKQYYIFNKPYSPDEYEKAVEALWSEGVEVLQKKFREFSLRYPRRFAAIAKSQGVTGDNVRNSKNCIFCFDAQDAQDSKFLSRIVLGAKDSYDLYNSGEGIELSYDTAVAGIQASRTFFSIYAVSGYNNFYSYDVHNSKNLFGCVALRHKKYCILNKEYTKGEYEALLPKVIKHLRAMPYQGTNGRVYTYGEFFPIELSLFSYNETMAQEFFPLTKEEAQEKGYRWQEKPNKEQHVSLKSNDLPLKSKDAKETITKEVIGCAHHGKCAGPCSYAFRIIPQELSFYQKVDLPLPRLCPNCRHYKRLQKRNPMKLWQRTCTCNGKASRNGVYENTIIHSHKDSPCANKFETSYSPERKEIVYCEKCYMAELA